jgi:hypothetical protein
MAKEAHHVGLWKWYLWLCVAVLTFTGITVLVSSNKLFYRGRVVVFVGKSGNPEILGISLTSAKAQNRAFWALSRTGAKVCIVAAKETPTSAVSRTMMSLDRYGTQWRRQ